MTNLLLVTTLVSLLSSATALLSSSCSGTRTSGSYEVSWEVIDDNISYVMFNVSAVTTGWVAVGFSLDQLMPETDVVVGGANDEGDNFIDDRYASARAQPPIDDSQDIMNYTASLVGGRQMISFVRAIDTGDSDDLSLNQCVYFLWAYGGPITGVGPPAVIGQHTARGVFNEQVCLNMCEEIITDPPPVEVACSGCTSTDNGLFTYCWTRRGEFVDFNATAQTELWVGLGVSMDRMMANTDVVIGAINPDDLTQYFLQDRYAIAQRLPPLDERQDISVLSVTTNDGYTTISFTRHVDTGDDEDDIDLTMCRYILWAYGGMVDFDTPGPSSPHTSRGVFSEQLCLPNITSCPVPDPCSGCDTNTDGTYTYCWTRYGDYVHFTVTAETDLWVGFGVSNNRMMAETDVVIGAANPADVTQFFVQDRYAIQQALPPLDESDDLMGVSATIENGYAIIRFTRLVDTGDGEDDIDLTECRNVLWAYGGTVDFDISSPTSPHTSTTRGVFSERLCLPDFATCPGPTVAAPVVTTPTPTPERAGAAMISVSIATLLLALLAAVLY